MGSGHSIPIGEGEVGPPRSGFVLRLCIRKADEAWGEAALGHGLADTRFCRTRTAELTVTAGRWFLSVGYPYPALHDRRSRGWSPARVAGIEGPRSEAGAGPPGPPATPIACGSPESVAAPDESFRTGDQPVET